MKRIEQILNDSLRVKQSLLNPDIINSINNVVELFVESFRNGNSVFFCGNGGSASDALHLATEFSGRFFFDRKPLPAIALGTNISALSAISNDFSYEEAYARLLESMANRNDVLVAISTSGNSINIINTARKAAELGVKVVSLTGRTGGGLKEHSDIMIQIPSENTPRIQECHITIGHIICELVEEELFKNG